MTDEVASGARLGAMMPTKRLLTQETAVRRCGAGDEGAGDESAGGERRSCAPLASPPTQPHGFSRHTPSLVADYKILC